MVCRRPYNELCKEADLDFVLNWPGALALVAFGLLPELLPLLFGTGEHARWDWGFPYATLHFVLLPPTCLFFLVGGIVQVVRGPGEARRRAVFPILAALAMFAMLVLEPFK